MSKRLAIVGPIFPNGVVTTDSAGRLRVSRTGANVDITDGEIDAASGSGSGDVVGPASAVDDRIATFDGVTGKLIQDGGKTIATVLSDAAAAAAVLDAALLPIDLTSEVTGDLPFANLAQASAASKLLGRGSGSGAGDYQEITLGTNLSMSGTTLNVTGVGSPGDVVGPASAVDDRIATFDGTSGKLIQDGGSTIAGVLASAASAAAALYAPLVHDSWVPLAVGLEPLAFVSDGAGAAIVVSYHP